MRTVLEQVRFAKQSTLTHYNTVLEVVNKQFRDFKDRVTDFKQEFLKRAIRRKLEKEVSAMKNPLEGVKVDGARMKGLIQELRQGLQTHL